MDHLSERKTLHVIALLKIAKGLVLLGIACAFLFLDQRSVVVSAIIDWVDEELLLVHNHVLLWILNKLEIILQVTNFRTTGYISLCYAALLFTEGVGVWKQQRWAEWLMIIGTCSLIPLEVYHFIHRPSFVKFCVIVMNLFIVWYLARTLKAHRPTLAKTSKTL